MHWQKIIEVGGLNQLASRYVSFSLQPIKIMNLNFPKTIKDFNLPNQKRNQYARVCTNVDSECSSTPESTINCSILMSSEQKKLGLCYFCGQQKTVSAKQLNIPLFFFENRSKRIGGKSTYLVQTKMLNEFNIQGQQFFASLFRIVFCVFVSNCKAIKKQQAK